jgi:AcrR family transcriptional regulator
MRTDQSVWSSKMFCMSSETPERPSPRERLLLAADRLFYEEGVSVGVDRILAESNVARASLYSTYGSKDELLRAYLQHRSQTGQATMLETLRTRWDTPREQIIGIFEMLTEWFEAPDYHGCPFINASAEAAPSLAIQDVRDHHRAWVRSLFADLARQAGASDPDGISAQLVLLYDGSMVCAQLDQSAQPGRAAQAAANVLLDARLHQKSYRPHGVRGERADGPS